MEEEQILIIAKEELGDFFSFTGFKPLKTSLDHLISPDDTLFQFRELVEKNPKYKQLIPYVILRHEWNIFRYWRTQKSGESRLHNLYSIGIGGHVNRQDERAFAYTSQILIQAANRELKEEVGIDEIELNHVGFINDERTDVGKVHLGIVFEGWVKSDKIHLQESALSGGKWINVKKLNDGVIYENWSTFLIDEYLNITYPQEGMKKI